MADVRRELGEWGSLSFADLVERFGAPTGDGGSDARALSRALSFLLFRGEIAVLPAEGDGAVRYALDGEGTP